MLARNSMINPEYDFCFISIYIVYLKQSGCLACLSSMFYNITPEGPKVTCVFYYRWRANTGYMQIYQAYFFLNYKAVFLRRSGSFF